MESPKRWVIKNICVVLDNGGGGGGGKGATKPASKLSNYVEQSEPQEITRASGEAAREGRKTHSRLLSGAALAWILATLPTGEPTSRLGGTPYNSLHGEALSEKVYLFPDSGKSEDTSGIQEVEYISEKTRPRAHRRVLVY